MEDAVNIELMHLPQMTSTPIPTHSNNALDSTIVSDTNSAAAISAQNAAMTDATPPTINTDTDRTLSNSSNYSNYSNTSSHSEGVGLLVPVVDSQHDIHNSIFCLDTSAVGQFYQAEMPATDLQVHEVSNFNLYYLYYLYYLYIVVISVCIEQCIGKSSTSHISQSHPSIALASHITIILTIIHHPPSTLPLSICPLFPISYFNRNPPSRTR